MAEYEWRHDTGAGLVRILQEADGLWHVYLDDRKWIGDFRLPDTAMDALVMYPHPFPEGVKYVGDSQVLGLSDNRRDWVKVRVK